MYKEGLGSWLRTSWRLRGLCSRYICRLVNPLLTMMQKSERRDDRRRPTHPIRPGGTCGHSQLMENGIRPLAWLLAVQFFRRQKLRGHLPNICSRLWCSKSFQGRLAGPSPPALPLGSAAMCAKPGLHAYHV